MVAAQEDCGALEPLECDAGGPYRGECDGHPSHIPLDGNHSGSAGRQQCPRQAARPGTDLQHGTAGKIAGGAGDLRGQIQIEQEVLTERFACGQSMPGNDLSQRRQLGRCRLRHEPPRAGRRCPRR